MKIGVAPHVSIRVYNGSYYAYDKLRNELYELDKASYKLLCGVAVADIERLSSKHIDFLNDCIERMILGFSDSCAREYSCDHWSIDDAPLYLLIHATEICNLHCGHCYLGEKRTVSLTLDQIVAAIDEFQNLGGQTVLVSGGEPLLHPQFWELNGRLDSFDLRFELLSNGTLIDRSVAEKLNFHEVQISIDGWKGSHDALRGSGSFEKAKNAVDALVGAGMPFSVATMITRHNSGVPDDMEKLERFCLSRGVVNWSVNAPCDVGEWGRSKARSAPNLEGSIAIMARYGYGEGQHDFGMKHACGGNLCTIMASGDIVSCVLSSAQPLGNVRRGIADAWRAKRPLLLSDTECAACEYVDLCRGGCRISALESSGSMFGKDLVQCAAIQRYVEGSSIAKGGEHYEA